MNHFLMNLQITDSFARAFQHFLCEERKKRGLSQFELAWRSGLSRQCLSFFESGRRIPTLNSLHALAKGFDMSLIKFMSMFLNRVDYYEKYGRMPAVADKKSPEWKVEAAGRVMS
jgi:transcriptional regulator with XRE-family HTH domain